MSSINQLPRFSGTVAMYLGTQNPVNTTLTLSRAMRLAVPEVQVTGKGYAREPYPPNVLYTGPMDYFILGQSPQDKDDKRLLSMAQTLGYPAIAIPDEHAGEKDIATHLKAFLKQHLQLP